MARHFTPELINDIVYGLFKILGCGEISTSFNVLTV
jgi:hypothetical protein